MIKKYFHAFADNIDEYFPTFKEAYRYVRELAKNGHKNLRIYEMFEDTKTEEITDGDCLYSKGEWPL